MIYNFITFDFTFWTIVGEVLFHSLWQGLVFWLLSGIALYFIPKNNPNFRYWIVVIAVFLFFATVCQTLLLSYSNLYSVPFASNEFEINDYWNTIYYYIYTSKVDNYSASIWFGVLWFLGLLMMLCRFIIAAVYTYWVGYTAQALENAQVYELKNLLMNQLHITEEVTLKVSKNVSCIFTYGFIKPVIVWPTGLINNLSEDEVTMILAHELMHIKRHDFLVKVFLSLINTILYYHPFIWWAIRVIDTEREFACDLGAIKECSTQTQYAQTLIKLQELKLNLLTQTANGFSDNKNFTNRIKRLFNMPVQNKSIKARLTILLLLITTAGLFAYKYHVASSNETDAVTINQLENTSNTIVTKVVMANSRSEKDTIPNPTYSKSTQVITKIEGDQTTTIKMADGKVIDVEVNGQKVDKSDFEKYSGGVERNIEIKRRWRGEREPEWESIEGNEDFPIRSRVPFDLDSLINGLPNTFFKFKNGADGTFSFSIDDMDKNLDSIMGGRMKMFNFNFDDRNMDSLMRGKVKMFGFGEGGQDFPFEMDKLMKEFQFDFNKMGDDNIIIKRGPRERGRPIDESIEKNEERTLSFMRSEKGNLTQVIEKQLKRDGLLKNGKLNKIELNNKQLKINGEKMPEVIFQKYKNLYENETGLKLAKGNQMVFELEYKEDSNRSYKAF
mgnify:CR=1 FL=1